MCPIAQVVTTRDEGLLAEVCHEAGMLGGPGHPAVAATLALITSHTPHLLITQYTDWVPIELSQLFMKIIILYGFVFACISSYY